MSRILVIGGYGGFGARLSRRLARTGHRPIVAGRDLRRAAAFAAQIPGAEAVHLDRGQPLGPALACCRPDLVIDAAGPFQASGYGVPEACIAAGLPYLDLADAREFVGGIGRLDAAARAAGVVIVSGASTSPALTAAAARSLAEGLEQVHSVEIALSAANRRRGGASVVGAVLSYVGRPIRLRRGGRWTEAFGWQELRRQDFRFADGSGLGPRLVALADLPDCALLPALLPGRPAVSFRAGTESALHMVMLWLVSWPVRWGWIGPLGWATRWLARLYGLTAIGGGKRSAMSVTVTGRQGGDRVERRWTIVAERGDGLEIPTLTAELVAADILAGRIPAGACDASRLLTLDRYRPCFNGLAVRHEVRERLLPAPLYERLLGPDFAVLPSAVRNLHDVCGDAGASGEGRVTRGRSLAARLVARMMGFPPSGDWPLHVAFAEHGGAETWTRDFGGHRFRSELSAAGPLLVERFGPLRFAFALPAGRQGLGMHLRRWSAFRVRLPLALAPRIRAREWQEDDRFRFEVAVALPLAGEVVRYAGWLLPLGSEAASSAGAGAPADA